ncbi:MAG: hypothetical protein IKE21_01555 [Erysipelotrichaceae bacterium]|nr:hypothetical protein [Erysipelotrichaceae bacterium]
MLIKYLDYAILGRLIHYKRIQQGISQKRLISLLPAGSSCSEKTFRNIESGIPVRYIPQIYRSIADCLGSSFSDDQDLYKEIRLLSEETYRILSENVLIEEIISFYKQLKEQSADQRDYIYISDLLQIYISAVEYYLFGRLNEGSLGLLTDLYPQSTDTDRKLISYLLFIGVRNDLLSEHDINLLRPGRDLINDPLFLYEEPYYDLMNRSIPDITAKYSARYAALQSDDGISLKYNAVFGMIAAQINSSDEENAFEILTSFLEHNSDDPALPEHYLLEMDKRAGIVAYSTERYRECEEIFLSIFRRNRKILGMNYLLLFNCLQKNEHFSLAKDTVQALSPDDATFTAARSIIVYFQKKYAGVPAADIEQFLLKELPPKEVLSRIYHRALIDEMRSLVKETGHYKLLSKYIG